MSSEVFHHSREPDPAWVKALEGIAPPSDRLSWLKLVWIPGEREDPVQRWGIYQMYPPMYTPSLALSDTQRFVWLKGWKVPDPRWPLQPEPRNLSTIQMDEFRRSGCIGQLFWVIQGFSGGHRRRFTHAEQSILAAKGVKDASPPIPGTRPYVEPDERVWRKLRALDQVRIYSKMIDVAERANTLDQEEQSALLDMKAEVWKWLETQVDEAVDMAGFRTWGRVRSDAPEGDKRFDEKFEKYQQRFLTTPD